MKKGDKVILTNPDPMTMANFLHKGEILEYKKDNIFVYGNKEHYLNASEYELLSNHDTVQVTEQPNEGVSLEEVVKFLPEDGTITIFSDGSGDVKETYDNKDYLFQFYDLKELTERVRGKSVNTGLDKIRKIAEDLIEAIEELKK